MGYLGVKEPSILESLVLISLSRSISLDMVSELAMILFHALPAEKLRQSNHIINVVLSLILIL